MGNDISDISHSDVIEVTACAEKGDDYKENTFLGCFNIFLDDKFIISEGDGNLKLSYIEDYFSRWNIYVLDQSVNDNNKNTILIQNYRTGRFLGVRSYTYIRIDNFICDFKYVKNKDIIRENILFQLYDDSQNITKDIFPDKTYRIRSIFSNMFLDMSSFKNEGSKLKLVKIAM